MIKVEVIKDFTLGKYNELVNVKSVTGYEEKGRLRTGDTFECSKEMCDYLTGNNPRNECVVKVIEVIPEKKEIELTPSKVSVDLAKSILKSSKKRKTSKK